MISRLKGIEGYWYLGSPYSKYPPGIEAAFKHVCQITGELIRLGVPVYSPIAHSHSVAIASGIDPFDHSIWLPADEPMMRGAHGLIIAMMETWRESYGDYNSCKPHKDRVI